MAVDRCLKWEDLEVFHSGMRPQGPQRASLPGGAARSAVIVRLLNFQDKDNILKVAWAHGPWRVESSTINIYPDYTNAVQYQREGFSMLKNTYAS